MTLLPALLAALLLSQCRTEAAEILGLFSHPGKSHFDFFRPMFLGLAQRGHSVSMYSYFPNKSPVANYTDYVFEGMPLLTDFVDLQIFESDTATLGVPYKIPTFFMLNSWGMRSCEVALQSPLLAALLQSGKRFDVIILEHFVNDCMMAVAHLLQAPVIALSSCAIMPWHYKRMGTPHINPIMPMNFLGYDDEMNFVARVNNFLHFHIVDRLHNWITQPATDELLRQRFGAGLPPTNEMVKNTTLLLINQHFALTGARPYAPNVVEVSGLQVAPLKPLPAHLLQLFETSSAGVVYISWGSMINHSTLPAAKRRELFRCIAQLSDYSFIMRWSNDTPADKPPNLHTFDWLPQRDLLCHPKVKAFMTHGGLLGTTEAVHCGVPMLVTPFYGDQFLNAAAVEQRKFGMKVNFADFNAEQLTKTLKSLLHPDFALAVKRSTLAYRQRPQTPLDLSLWWVEHVIETQGAPLAQSIGRHINWFTYNSFDVYLLLLCVIVLLVGICWLFAKLLWQLLLRPCIRVLAKAKPKAKLN